jgi:hypothetical protein
MKTIKTFRDLYSFPGFRARATLKPHTKDPEGRIVRLERRQKKQSAPFVAGRYQAFGTDGLTWCGIWMLVQSAYTLNLNTVGLPARSVKP